MSEDLFQDLVDAGADVVEGGGEIVDELAEGDLEGAANAAADTAEELGEDLGEVGEDVAEAAGEVVNVSVDAGGVHASFDVGDGQTGVHAAVDLDLDFADGSGGASAEAGGAVLGATAGGSVFAGVRTVGEGADRQTGLESGAGIEFLGTEVEAGQTINVDTDTSGDGSSQTGVDIGFFGSLDGVRAETGVTVNIDEELDPDGGRQTGIDSGVFVEVAGHRAETGVTANVDTDVNPDGSSQTGGEIGVFGEFDSHRTEATVGGNVQADGLLTDEKEVAFDLALGVEADELRAETGVAFAVEVETTRHSDTTSTTTFSGGVEGFAEAEGHRADAGVELEGEATISVFPFRDENGNALVMPLGGGIRAEVFAEADDEGVGLDVEVRQGGSRLFETNEQADLFAVGVGVRAGDNEAFVQAGVNLDGTRDADGNTVDVGVDLGVGAGANEHFVEASVTANVSGVGTSEEAFDVGVAAEADANRVEAGVFARHANDPDKVTFIPEFTGAGVFAQANDSRVEAGIDIDDLESEPPPLAAAPAKEAAVPVEPAAVVRRAKLVADLDADGDEPVRPAPKASKVSKVPTDLVIADDDVPTREPDAVKEPSRPSQPVHKRVGPAGPRR
jgi:hypothetical protein